VFSLTTFYKKHFKVRLFKIDPTSVKQDQKIFLKCRKRSGSDCSLQLLFRNGCGSSTIKSNKWRWR